MRAREPEEEQEAPAAAGRLRWRGCLDGAPRSAAWTSAVVVLPLSTKPVTVREHFALVKRAETLALAASMRDVATEELTRPRGGKGPAVPMIAPRHGKPRSRGEGSDRESSRVCGGGCDRVRRAWARPREHGTREMIHRLSWVLLHAWARAVPAWTSTVDVTVTTEMEGRGTLHGSAPHEHSALTRALRAARVVSACRSRP